MRMKWTKVADQLPDDQQVVLIAIATPHAAKVLEYDVATFYAHGFADAVHVKDFAWERGAGWGFDRDSNNYILAWAALPEWQGGD